MHAQGATQTPPTPHHTCPRPPPPHPHPPTHRFINSAIPELTLEQRQRLREQNTTGKRKAGAGGAGAAEQRQEEGEEEAGGASGRRKRRAGGGGKGAANKDHALSFLDGLGQGRLDVVGGVPEGGGL